MTSQLVFSAPVERSPGRAPTAFLMWPAGEVVTDRGVFFLTNRSVALLLEDQASKKLRYPFDLNHLSLDPQAPPSSSCAVGWHGLESRDGALWAVDCEWSPEIRKGLEQKPPAWRYYSPVFLTDPETREIVKYVGCAITNTPATHGATDLALAASAVGTFGAVGRGLADLPPNPELDRAMGLVPLEQVASFDPKSQVQTFGVAPGPAQRQRTRSGAPVAVPTSVADLPPNPELDRAMGLVPVKLGVHFDPKSQVQTFGVMK